ncbi:MAG: tetratricopeptide repeat protein [Bacteroidia bacterium]|nr:tetratricopeptide repeat protein [Bacteroidia bacterium]MDW8157720.1 tetratricopeptide repeat protein [Bacteroidia bacterium]
MVITCKKYTITTICFVSISIFFQFQSCKITQKNYYNLAPEVKYVGIQKCASCHQEIYQSYIQTGMGRSFYKPNEQEKIEDFRQIVYDSYSNFYYQAFWKEANLYIKEFRLNNQDTIYQRIEKIDYIVGSGNQTRSYLILRNGFLYEAPITWYVARKKWDLSPGYEGGKNTRFERAIGYECMACHNAYPKMVSGTVNKYEHIPLGIDCERCHGPGQLHVQAMEKDEIVDVEKEIDYTIVNPSKLPIDLQFDVCQQCHLQGIVVRNSAQEFRPGMALHKAFDVFLPERKDSTSFGIASHAERLRYSKCFQKAKITCITCHDPHKSIHGSSIIFYNQICQKCHASCSTSREELMKTNYNCTACHMPKGNTSDIPHVNFTDHFIRSIKKPLNSEKSKTPFHKIQEVNFLKLLCATSNTPSTSNIGKAYLYYYEQQENNEKYLDLALSYLGEECFLERSKVLFYRGNLEKALQLAQRAKAKQPTDVLVIFHLANVLESLGKYNEAIQELTSLIEAYPSLVEAYNRAAILLLKQSRKQKDVATFEKAKSLLLKAYKVKPSDIPTLNNLSFIYLNSGEFNKAHMFIEAVLKLDPDNSKALENKIYWYLSQNATPKARECLEHLKKVNPNLAQQIIKKIKI